MRIFIIPILLLIYACSDHKASPDISTVKKPESSIEEVWRTRNGAIFKRVKDTTIISTMGQSYRDPEGLMWTDAAKNPNGTIRDFGSNGYNDALSYCQKHGFRLPKREEYIRLVGYMSMEPYINGPNKTYEPEILPNLVKPGLWWTFTPNYEMLSHRAFAFFGAKGSGFFDMHCWSGCFARCVK